MNTSKYKATTVLTAENFPPFSRLSTKTFNPKFLSITPPHENTLFCCNNITKTLLQTITTEHEMKTKNRKLKSSRPVQQQCDNAIIP